jgi:hypothetical protein
MVPHLGETLRERNLCSPPGDGREFLAVEDIGLDIEST